MLAFLPDSIYRSFVPLQHLPTSSLMAIGGLATLGAAAQYAMTYKNAGSIAHSVHSNACPLLGMLTHTGAMTILSRRRYLRTLAQIYCTSPRLCERLVCVDDYPLDEKVPSLLFRYRNGLEAQLALAKDYNNLVAKITDKEPNPTVWGSPYALITLDSQKRLLAGIPTKNPRRPMTHTIYGSLFSINTALHAIATLNPFEVQLA